MAVDGFHGDLCRYCSLGYASTRYQDAVEPLWGGLPTPRLLCARLTCDCVHRVFSLWAAALGAELFEIDHPGASDLPPMWWELGRHRWRELVEPHRLAFGVATLERLVQRLEAISGGRFDRGALRHRLELVNEQEEIFDAVRRLIAAAPESPVRMTEQISNVMATQWVRGTAWALSHARAFHDEVKQRVDAGVAACPGERIRLMWVGAGLWHDMDFYTAFEASHRAVFVWSMYLAFGPDGYIRYGLDNPMAALASRMASFNEYLHNPPWASEWIVHQAREHRIDGALVLRPRRMKAAGTGRLFIEHALEDAGVPVLPIEADVVDAREWDGDAARASVRSFLETRMRR
jgi:benzoyl-CoA reductase/2-hydroxyglutaryl-CoA dehydratase subunit BcrC/BadD/HgdB